MSFSRIVAYRLMGFADLDVRGFVFLVVFLLVTGSVGLAARVVLWTTIWTVWIVSSAFKATFGIGADDS